VRENVGLCSTQSFEMFRVICILSAAHNIQIYTFVCLFYVYTGYCYGVVSHKASQAPRPFSDLLCVPILILNIRDTSSRVLRQIPAGTPSIEAGILMARNDR
jgi:hypothetical protein